MLHTQWRMQITEMIFKTLSEGIMKEVSGNERADGKDQVLYKKARLYCNGFQNNV